MQDNLLPIGKMAEINQVTIATLRLYDKLGLLTPSYVEPNSGYRYYAIQQNTRLDMIAYMKELGMSLGEIRDVLQKEDLRLIEEILVRKSEQIHQQIRELKARQAAVNRAIASIDRYRESPRTGTISLEYIDRRYIWAIPCKINFYEQDIRSYEEALIQLRQALLASGISQPHSYNTGTTIAMEDYVQAHFIPDRVFIFSERQIREQDEHTDLIDSGMFACIYLDNYDDELEYAKILLEHCRKQQYVISGSYICEVLTEFNVFGHDQRSMFLRLQVPVSFFK